MRPATTGPIRVRATQCSTCIYREDSCLDLQQLEDEVRDPRAPDHFADYRVCHSPASEKARECCAGFAARHGRNCTPLQISERFAALLKLP